jgi:hypothetical protein
MSAIIPSPDPVSTALNVASLFLGFGAASSQKAAADKAAKEKAEVGRLEAQQYVADMFLGRAQAIDAGTRRLEEAEYARSQNVAMFSAMETTGENVVRAYLERNARMAREDIGGIARMSEIEQAKKRTEATVAYTYGQNAAAGIRAQGNANFLTNLYSLSQNISPLFKTNNTVYSEKFGQTLPKPQLRP